MCIQSESFLFQSCNYNVKYVVVVAVVIVVVVYIHVGNQHKVGVKTINVLAAI